MVATPSRAPITSQRMNGYPAPRRLRLALLDDHEVVRRGTALHLCRDVRFNIVASHTHSDAFIGCLRKLAVDVAIIDLTRRPATAAVMSWFPCCGSAFLMCPCWPSPR